MSHETTHDLSNDVAPSNIHHVSVVDDIDHELKNWLNDAALRNIPAMVVTLRTSQSFNGWLNEVALSNIYLISVHD